MKEYRREVVTECGICGEKIGPAPIMTHEDEDIGSIFYKHLKREHPTVYNNITKGIIEKTYHF